MLLPQMIYILPGTLQGWQSNLLLASSAAASGVTNCWITRNISGKPLRIHPLGLLRDIRGCSFAKSINLMFSSASQPGSTVPVGIETYAGHSHGWPFHKGWGENPGNPCGVRARPGRLWKTCAAKCSWKRDCYIFIKTYFQLSFPAQPCV